MFTPINAAFEQARIESRSNNASANHLGSSIGNRVLENLKPTKTLIGACLVLDSLGENSDQREEIERMKEKEASRFCC
jgi:hypothetical protein